MKAEAGEPIVQLIEHSPTFMVWCLDCGVIAQHQAHHEAELMRVLHRCRSVPIGRAAAGGLPCESRLR